MKFSLITLSIFFSLIVGSSASRADDDFPIIDAHTHTHFTGKPERTSGIMDTQEQYLKELKGIGAVGAVALTNTTRSDYHDLSAENIVACAGTGAKVNAAEIEAGLKAGKFNCIKIYLGYEHQWAYSENYEPAYKLAEKYKVPVVFHTGDTYSVDAKLKYADPMTIDEVAVDHPNVTFVIAHCGNPWIESAAEVAYKNPNVYLDGSAFLIGDLSKTPKAKVDEFVVKPLAWIFGYLEDPSKLMYGTDWPLTDMKSYLAAFKRAIPKKYWREVFYENAYHIFKFPKPMIPRPAAKSAKK
jgi:predicted TIM-barrel fold metal-dependent hydrolase